VRFDEAWPRACKRRVANHSKSSLFGLSSSSSSSSSRSSSAGGLLAFGEGGFKPCGTLAAGQGTW
jgi:hypothetical protein